VSGFDEQQRFEERKKAGRVTMAIMLRYKCVMPVSDEGERVARTKKAGGNSCDCGGFETSAHGRAIYFFFGPEFLEECIAAEMQLADGRGSAIILFLSFLVVTQLATFFLEKSWGPFAACADGGGLIMLLQRRGYGPGSDGKKNVVEDRGVRLY
jgi:hypothetical protein